MANIDYYFSKNKFTIHSNKKFNKPNSKEVYLLGLNNLSYKGNAGLDKYNFIIGKKIDDYTVEFNAPITKIIHYFNDNQKLIEILFSEDRDSIIGGRESRTLIYPEFDSQYNKLIRAIEDSGLLNK